MEVRSNIPSLQRAWVAGCIFSGVLLLMGGTGWLLDVGVSRGTLIGYGVSALVVLVFSRGLYHRSIVSGVLLLPVALGPMIQGVVHWTTGPVGLGQSFSVLLKGGVALFGIVLTVMVIRAIYRLSTEGEAQTFRHDSRFT